MVRVELILPVLTSSLNQETDVPCIERQRRRLPPSSLTFLLPPFNRYHMAELIGLISSTVTAVAVARSSMKMAGNVFGGGFGSQSKDLRRMQKQVAADLAAYRNLIQSLLMEILDDEEQATRMLDSPGDEMWKDSKIQRGIQDLMGQHADGFVALCLELGKQLMVISRELDQVRLVIIVRVNAYFW